jgi:4-alpha-glucanotransferase
MPAYRRLSLAPAVMLIVTHDDVVAEAERPNVPRADGQCPNWSIALPVSLESLEATPAAAIAELLAASVKLRGRLTARWTTDDRLRGAQN